MKHLDRLWDYQTMQLGLEEFEYTLKNTPTRKKLVKLQRFLQMSQQKLLEMENAAKVKQHKIAELEAKNKVYLEDLEDLEKDLGYFSECDVEELDAKEVQDTVKNVEKIYDNIVLAKKLLSQIKQELEATDKQVHDSLQKMRAAKSEYEELWEVYQKEIASGSDELKARQAEVAEAAKNVPKAMLDEYNRIKGFRTNPVAVVADSRCGGCNMQLPSGIAARVKNSETLIECENCGRILFIKDE